MGSSMPTSGVDPTTVTVIVVDGSVAGVCCGSCVVDWLDELCARASTGSVKARTLQVATVRYLILKDIPRGRVLFTVSIASRMAASTTDAACRMRRGSMSKESSVFGISLPASLIGYGAESTSAQDDVLSLFDECAAGLRRYIASFGLPAEVTEDVVQE